LTTNVGTLAQTLQVLAQVLAMAETGGFDANEAGPPASANPAESSSLLTGISPFGLSSFSLPISGTGPPKNDGGGGDDVWKDPVDRTALRAGASLSETDENVATWTSFVDQKTAAPGPATGSPGGDSKNQTDQPPAANPDGNGQARDRLLKVGGVVGLTAVALGAGWIWSGSPLGWLRSLGSWVLRVFRLGTRGP
jgi:hypothetical protein